MKTYFTVRELPVSERPYEKFEKYGPSKLSDAELLAIIIRTGARHEQATEVARKLLMHSTMYSGLKGLNYLSLSELITSKIFRGVILSPASRSAASIIRLPSALKSSTVFCHSG